MKTDWQVLTNFLPQIWNFCTFYLDAIILLITELRLSTCSLHLTHKLSYNEIHINIDKTNRLTGFLQFIRFSFIPEDRMDLGEATEEVALCI